MTTPDELTLKLATVRGTVDQLLAHIRESLIELDGDATEVFYRYYASIRRSKLASDPEGLMKVCAFLAVELAKKDQ